MKILRNSFRILVGMVFIFSGFVKGVDPLGLAFRIEDYFVAFGIPWASRFSLELSIIFIMLEFTLGISLLLNLWIRKTAWLLLLIMTYFTVLTFLDAIWNLVPDCGCFGEAIKLTNMQTFIKNIILMGFVVPIFIWRKKYRSALPVTMDILIVCLTAILFSWMSLHAARHLPLIDFMAWKKGNKVNRTSALPVKFYVTYKNKKTGEKKEFLTPNYPWNDSVWMSQWTFLGQRADDLNQGTALNLRAEDEAGNDVTPSVINNPDLQFILVSYDLSSANKDAFRKILLFAKKALNDNYSFVCITNAFGPDVKKFRMANGTLFDFYSADDVVLKTMIRSNPGLILIKNGVVLKKWHYNDFPDYEAVKKQFAGK